MQDINKKLNNEFSGKEARKKELKKNKKQRQMVRQAVLKNKDPSQLIEEMEQIDEMGKRSSTDVQDPVDLNFFYNFRIQRYRAITIK